VDWAFSGSLPLKSAGAGLYQLPQSWLALCGGQIYVYPFFGENSFRAVTQDLWQRIFGQAERQLSPAEQMFLELAKPISIDKNGWIKFKKPLRDNIAAFIEHDWSDELIAEGNVNYITFRDRQRFELYQQTRAERRLEQEPSGKKRNSSGLQIGSTTLISGENPERSSPIIEHADYVATRLVTAARQDPSLLFRIDSREFEVFVGQLFSERGFDVELTPMIKDGGYDLIVTGKSELGTARYLVECKRFSPNNPVEVGLVRQLFGLVSSENATGAVLATTSRFTKGAVAFQGANLYRLKLLAYKDLVQFLNKTEL
jgi:HJR/Mrr/RecB family endonuclease